MLGNRDHLRAFSIGRQKIPGYISVVLFLRLLGHGSFFRGHDRPYPFSSVSLRDWRAKLTEISPFSPLTTELKVSGAHRRDTPPFSFSCLSPSKRPDPFSLSILPSLPALCAKRGPFGARPPFFRYPAYGTLSPRSQNPSDPLSHPPGVIGGTTKSLTPALSDAPRPEARSPDPLAHQLANLTVFFSSKIARSASYSGLLTLPPNPPIEFRL